ncbi:hypothetical protein Tco_0317759 [Tanacetum coccineum]
MKKLTLTSYTPYPLRKIRRICACTSQETMKIQRPIRRIQSYLYAVFKIKKQNILEDIPERGPYSKKPPIRHIQVTRYTVVSFENDDLKSMSGLNTHSDRNDVGSSNPNPFSSGDNRETNRMNKFSVAGFDGWVVLTRRAKGEGSGDLQQGALNTSYSQSFLLRLLIYSELRKDEVVEGVRCNALPHAAVEELKKDEVKTAPNTASDGFEVVKKKKKHQKQVDGVVLNKPSITLHYRRVDRESSIKNSFSALNEMREKEWKDTTTWQHTNKYLDVLNESDSEVDKRSLWKIGIDPPKEFDQDEILAQLDRLPTRVKGKHPSYGGVKIKRNVHVELNWTKRSCFKHKVTDNDTNITGLKSHDYHIMMQRLLPYGLQQYLPDMIAKPIIKLCSLFKQIYSATLMEDDMLKAQIKVVDILCDLELIYPPALFDIMIHLVIHLPLEALEGGLIRPRWMFPFERYMKKLKGYVRNKAKLEGSIAEGYVAEEALTFSSHYF